MTDGFELRDDVVGLRALTANDAEAIAEACQDREIVRWTWIPTPYSLDDAIEFVELTERWRSERSAFTFAVEDLHSGSFVGTIGLECVLDPPARIGYWIGPWARRRGFASRSLALVSTWALRDHDLEAVELVIKIGNEPSERVAANAGFEFAGEIDDHLPPRSNEPIRVRRWVLTRGM